MNKTFKVLCVVALVVGLVALVAALSGRSSSSGADQSQSLGGVYANNISSSGAGAGIDFGPSAVNVNYQGGLIGAKTNTAWYRNVSGVIQYAENVEVSTNGYASSSYTFYAYATSTAPTAQALYDFTAPANQASTTLLIKGFSIATSSAATTTSSDDTIGGAGPFAGSVAQLPPNWYLYVKMVAKNGLSCASSGGLCESATSTARGFNIPWRAMVHN